MHAKFIEGKKKGERGGAGKCDNLFKDLTPCQVSDNCALRRLSAMKKQPQTRIASVFTRSADWLLHIVTPVAIGDDGGGSG
uniref:Uncharacterized protein n=1 Tax=Syphacia muris TaxID=451379 RepID=A0A0N5A8G4_9BILA